MAVFGLRRNEILLPGKIQPHAKAGIMPSTHSSEKQEDPTLAVILGAVFLAGAQYFAEHYVVLGYIISTQFCPVYIVKY